MNILLGICGSISAYKAPDIARGLINQGHNVKVVLTKGALEFVNPSVFKYLGVESTYLPHDDFNYAQVLHIQLSKWCDSLVIVPASANTLAKLAHGQCDDLLSSIFLSLPEYKVKIIYPAMNTQMMNSPISQSNFKTLIALPNCFFMESDSGMLACGDEGKGKLPEVRGIIDIIPLLSNKKVNKKVLITAGATLSNIDTVRYVTNPARGGTSYLLAKKYLSEGYSVHMIKGQDVISEFKHLTKHPNYTEETVSTTQDLLKAVSAQWSKFDIYISPMAVSDIEFEYTDHKIKKSTLGGEFKFKYAPDVLKFVVENKLPHQLVVGFAAESDLSDKTISEKITRKPVDLLVANLVNSGFNNKDKKGFGTRSGHYKLVTNVSSEEFVSIGKEKIVELIFEKIK